MWSIGIDVHQRSFAVCILDEHGKMVKQMRLRGILAKLLDTLRSIKEPFAVCYEASCGYGHLHDLFGKRAKRVVVAHPGQLRLIFRTKRKNDRVVAKKPATLLFLDQVPAIHVPSVDVRSWGSLIEFRHRLVAKRTRVKNALRAVLRGHGVGQPLGKKLWTRCGVAGGGGTAHATDRMATGCGCRRAGASRDADQAGGKRIECHRRGTCRCLSVTDDSRRRAAYGQGGGGLHRSSGSVCA